MAFPESGTLPVSLVVLVGLLRPVHVAASLIFEPVLHPDISSRNPIRSGAPLRIFPTRTRRAMAAVAMVLLLLSAPAFAESLAFRVPACRAWAHTKVRVEEGRRYRVEVLDLRGVKDASIRIHDLDGWPGVARVVGAPFFWLRRRPFDPWFSLIATVDRRHPRRLREGAVYVAPASGELVCYFNDALFAYWNNHGTARLRLVPLSNAAAHTHGRAAAPSQNISRTSP